MTERIRPPLPGLPIVRATGYADLPSGGETTLARLGKPNEHSEPAVEIAKPPAAVGVDVRHKS